MAPQGRLALVTVAAVLFVCVGTALAAAPGVLYEDPTNVTQSGAVLQGSINPSDKPTTYYFEYGSSTGYGAMTAQATLPKSKAWQAVSAVITGLSAGATYHYRIVAWNGGGTKDKTVGSDHTFTTASPPDPPSSPGDTTPDVSGGGDTLPDQMRRGESRGQAPADARGERSSACRSRPRSGPAASKRQVRAAGDRRRGSAQERDRREPREGRAHLRAPLGAHPNRPVRRRTVPAATRSPGLPRPLPPRLRLPDLAPARACRVDVRRFRPKAARQPSVGA